MAPILRFIISSGSKKKVNSYACLSEAKASHTHRTWTEVSSSAPHFPQVELLLNPIIEGIVSLIICEEKVHWDKSAHFVTPVVPKISI